VNPSPDTLYERFLAIARRYPQRPAVADAAGAASYGALASLSRAVAEQLAGRCGPGELVALSVGRSRLAVAGILGILAVGAGYLPVDPAYPRSRQQYLLEDSGTRLIVSDAGPRSGVLDVTGHAATREVPVPEGTAYSIYTSGSTGAPKGCLVGHRQVLALMDAALPLYGTGPQDVWSVFHSWSFDFSVWETWGALLTGGCAHIIDRATAADPRAFHESLRENGVTMLSQVPSAFTQLVAEAESAGTPLDGLRHVIFGGEAVIPQDIRRWWRASIAPDARLVNMYGITETTVHVTYCPLTDAVLAAAGAGRTPIGVPLPHLQVELRDEDGLRVPAGTPGEMWVSGAGVCDGYLGRPDLTAMRFVHDTAADGSSRRYYRSGDWAVADEHGVLAYAGRRDGQVKLRGFRIELGEIESAARAAEGVAAAGCFVGTDPEHGTPVLTVCVVAGANAPTAAALRRHLTEVLPPHMLPHRIRFAEGLPLTPHGKLDRRALAEAVSAAG